MTVYDEIQNELARFHRNACYPNASPTEIEIAASEINRLVASAIVDARNTECREIAYLIDAEAQKHADAAAEMQMDDDPDQEAWMHNADAAMLSSLAETVRKRWELPEPEHELTEEEILF